jgi:threonine dehydratase
VNADAAVEAAVPEPPTALPSLAAVAEARRVLNTRLPVTRLVPAPALSERTGAAVLLKLESELPTGSFKPRGAIWALARRLREGAVHEVVASSTGNHGAAVAYAASLLGVTATIFLPAGANPVKRARITSLGARLVEGGADLAEAAVGARAHAAAAGAFFLDDATDPHLPAGPATIAAELFEQAPEAGTIVVPVGDSALIRGVAAVAQAQPHPVRVIGVQADRAPSYYLSWRAGVAVETDTCDTIADGLATRTPQPPSVAALRAAVDAMVLVGEDALLDAVAWLLLEEHVVAEPSGAAATAAVLAGALGEARDGADRPVVLLVTGANLSPDVLRRAAART